MPRDRQPVTCRPVAPVTRMGSARRRHSIVIAILALVSALLGLAAGQGLPAPVLVPGSTGTQLAATPCPTCTQVTQISALTQANIDASARQAQASATADIQNAHILKGRL